MIQRNLKKIDILEKLNVIFSYFYFSTIVLKDGAIYEIRKRVENIGGIKVDIYPNEHTPPHFHIKSENIDAMFSISDCSLIRGRIDSKSRKKVEYFYKHSKALLIEAWNDTRPSDCPVGKI